MTKNSYACAVATAIMSWCAVGCSTSDAPSATAPTQAQTLNARYKQAHRLIEQNDASAAKPMLDEVLAGQPDHPRALFDRGLIHMVEGRLPEAVADLDRAAALAPKDIRVLGGQCVVLVAAGQTQRGLDVCEDAVALGRDADPNALTARGQARLLTGQDKLALADFEMALQYKSNHARAIYGQGLVQQRLGDDATGRRNMARALKMLPGAARDFSTGPKS
jgi:Tfp pilus assembly protein PilF